MTRVRAEDRRVNSVQLTAAGTELLDRVGAIAKAHNDHIQRGLSAAERRELHTLLSRLAGDLGATSGIHPGYAMPTALRSAGFRALGRTGVARVRE